MKQRSVIVFSRFSVIWNQVYKMIKNVSLVAIVQWGKINYIKFF